MQPDCLAGTRRRARPSLLARLGAALQRLRTTLALRSVQLLAFETGLGGEAEAERGEQFRALLDVCEVNEFDR